MQALLHGFLSCRVVVAWLSLALLSFGELRLAQADTYAVQSAKHAFHVNKVLDGLENPWSMAFLPDGRMLITERAGRLRLVTKSFQLHPTPIAGLPKIKAAGQGGLFDVAIHPDYAANGWIYWAYNEPGAGGWGTALARGKLQGTQMTSVEVLFSMRPKSRKNQHFGGRIVFDTGGFVYLTLGDRGDRDRAQKMDDHAGSVIRLHEDGRVPEDNPFVKLKGALPEKWTLGNRNIQGAALHPQTGKLWTHEHGPQGGDEVNLMSAGKNYGWPVVTHGANYGLGTKIGEGQTKAGMAQALKIWVPSIAPSGMAFVNSQEFPEWSGNLLVGSLRAQTLVRLELDGDAVVGEERLLVGQIGRIRDVRVAEDGLIYLLTDAPNGALFQLARTRR
ncbi:MAG: PQQ-dependent sugar dehydrogenase [Burkholderiaceae bacterium]|nr:PQQ-dependent sugar dehydrogenase [Burkholderiaceae bacterium]